MDAVFTRIRDSLTRFMVGRNGADRLNRALLIGYIALWVLRTVLAAFEVTLLARLCDVLMNAGAVYLIFRMLSRNLAKRQAENLWWMRKEAKLSAWWRRTGIEQSVRGAAARHADKEHRYFTCRNCKAICRVPKGKGKIVITCPKCGAQIKGKS